jgi:hypothetical protein
MSGLVPSAKDLGMRLSHNERVTSFSAAKNMQYYKWEDMQNNTVLILNQIQDVMWGAEFGMLYILLWLNVRLIADDWWLLAVSGLW